ncbi:MAG: hypothetical protein R2824_30540 [Saprospiraceae bacterium]|nr:hypothetical protein [Lewinella sp.]
MKKYFEYVLLMSVCGFLSCAGSKKMDVPAETVPGEVSSTTTSPAIDFWYGHQQRFGHIGQAQCWINILGNISNAENLDRVLFQVNDGPEQPLTLGSDQHRLAMPGDFNVELAWDEMPLDTNRLTVRVYPKQGDPVTDTMQVIVDKEEIWPLPYSVNFSGGENIQNQVQVVDGRWESTASGVRTVLPYYDRVLSMGDTTWTDYEATVQLTVHGFIPPAPGPPTYNVTHFGVALRWRGHHTDGRQPSRKWYPLGAQGEFLLKNELDSCQWRILFDGGNKNKPIQYASGRNRLIPEQRMTIKAQVQTMPDSRTRYRFKQWTSVQAEPATWDVEGFEAGDYPSGALCLVPHNSDVTIHSVQVVSLDN